ncbi:hypothetical protein WJX74_001756 [Apatococcus lobatus]|uniref:beta-N-acetylhexosaminidase n=1 Tax=Apatococcus lobatus TaxID=904363 RepID=A0AAW1RW78_9CHLO
MQDFVHADDVCVVTWDIAWVPLASDGPMLWPELTVVPAQAAAASLAAHRITSQKIRAASRFLSKIRATAIVKAELVLTPLQAALVGLTAFWNGISSRLLTVRQWLDRLLGALMRFRTRVTWHLLRQAARSPEVEEPIKALTRRLMRHCLQEAVQKRQAAEYLNRRLEAAPTKLARLHGRSASACADIFKRLHTARPSVLSRYEETLCTLCMRVQKHGRSMAAAKLADSAPKDCRCTSAEVAPSSCTYLPASQSGRLSAAMGIIPAPLRVRQVEGNFRLPELVTVGHQDHESRATADYLVDYFQERLQLDSSAELAAAPEGGQIVSLRLSHDLPNLVELPHNSEAYELRIQPEGISISALKPHGLFNGVQSLLQLLPATPPADEVLLECTEIVDGPRFTWRGALLDVGRHYFSVPFILKFLDSLALHKINKFHWHLTEDQGWRLEVKAYPKLTSFGSIRIRGDHKYGGFYTQDEVREVVKYAAERFIEVVPEIELPGHCGAALACYPELSCTGQVKHVPAQWGIHEDVYCAGKDSTFKFLETVLGEVMDLFPSSYIHIGGDECPKVRWQKCPRCQERIKEEGLMDEYHLQSWFISRISKFLYARKKHMIGWDEILEGGIPHDAVVMSWRGILGGIRAAQEGHQVIMTPTSNCYFDYRQSLRSDEPGAWYAMLPLEMVYAFDPIPPEPDEAVPMSRDSQDSLGDGDSKPTSNGGSTAAPHLPPEWVLDRKDASNILGGQACVWTEYISDEATAEYMTFPRLSALAECVWSAPHRHDWEDFVARLKTHVRFFEAMELEYRPVG